MELCFCLHYKRERERERGKKEREREREREKCYPKYFNFEVSYSKCMEKFDYSGLDLIDHINLYVIN